MTSFVEERRLTLTWPRLVLKLKKGIVRSMKSGNPQPWRVGVEPSEAVRKVSISNLNRKNILYGTH
jgi:hypothetical protein